MSILISSKFSGDYGRNPDTGEHWLEEAINRRAREKGQQKSEGHTYDYDLFDREGYITTCLEAGRPFIITWVPNTLRLECRCYRDIYGISDIVDIEEVPTLFSGVKGMESFRVFLIPYLLTGYDIPEKIERDEEPLVPFTAKTLSILKEIEEENVQV